MNTKFSPQDIEYQEKSLNTKRDEILKSIFGDNPQKPKIDNQLIYWGSACFVDHVRYIGFYVNNFGGILYNPDTKKFQRSVFCLKVSEINRYIFEEFNFEILEKQIQDQIKIIIEQEANIYVPF